jgi:hypothetical protein
LGLGLGYRYPARARLLCQEKLQSLAVTILTSQIQIHISLPPKSLPRSHQSHPHPASRSTATYFSHLPNSQPTNHHPRDLPQANIKNKPHTAIRHHTPSHSIRITAAAEPLGARAFLYPYSFSAATAATLERGRAQPRCKKIPSNSDIDNKQRFSPESPSSQSAET